MEDPYWTYVTTTINLNYENLDLIRKLYHEKIDFHFGNSKTDIIRTFDFSTYKRKTNFDDENINDAPGNDYEPVLIKELLDSKTEKIFDDTVKRIALIKSDEYGDALEECGTDIIRFTIEFIKENISVSKLIKNIKNAEKKFKDFGIKSNNIKIASFSQWSSC